MTHDFSFKITRNVFNNISKPIVASKINDVKTFLVSNLFNGFVRLPQVDDEWISHCTGLWIHASTNLKSYHTIKLSWVR